MNSLRIIFILLLTGCGAGYHRVQYAEMPKAPIVTLTGNELIVTTRNSNGEGLSVYKIDIEIRDKARIVELKGYQAIGKSEKTEFKIELSEKQLAWIEHYTIYWIDRGRKKNRIDIVTK